MTPEEIETFLSSPTGREVIEAAAEALHSAMHVIAGDGLPSIRVLPEQEAANLALRAALSHRVGGTPCPTCDGYDYESDVVTYRKHPVGEPPEPCPNCAGSGVVNQEPALIPRSALVQVGVLMHFGQDVEISTHPVDFDEDDAVPVYRLGGPA